MVDAAIIRNFAVACQQVRLKICQLPVAARRISGFLYTSFTNCSPQAVQNPVSLKHKEAALRKAPRRDNSSLSNRHSSISPLFSLFLSRKAAGSDAGGFSHLWCECSRWASPFRRGGSAEHRVGEVLRWDGVDFALIFGEFAGICVFGCRGRCLHRPTW